MVHTIIAVLLVASAFGATYGFLVLCNGLGRRLAERGVIDDLRPERTQTECCSDIAASDSGAPDSAVPFAGPRATIVG